MTQSNPQALSGQVHMGGYQLPLPVSTPCTCGGATKRQGDFADAQRNTHKVGAVSRLTWPLHLNIIGAMVGFVWSRRQIFSYY